MEQKGFPWTEQHEVQTSQGPVKLPILYYDTGMTTAVFRAPRKNLNRLLEPTPLLPIGWGPDFGMVWITCFEYREVTLEPYNELSVSVPCYLQQQRGVFEGLFRRLALRDMSLLVLHLPVTTQEARGAGWEMWGYPKHVERIDYDESGADVKFELGWKSGTDIAVNVPKAGGFGVPAFPVTSFTVKGTDVIRTKIPARFSAALHRGRGASLTLGEGPVSETLKSLETEETPLFTLTSTRYQCQLPEGRAVARAEGPPSCYETAIQAAKEAAAPKKKAAKSAAKK